MRVQCMQRGSLSVDEQREWHVEYRDRDALLAASDWLCVQLPDNAGTRDYLDHAQFACIKPGAKLINVPRAQVANRAALRAERLSGFTLDPQYEEPDRDDDELLAFDNVILTLHVAAMPRHNALDDFRDLAPGTAAAMAYNFD